MTGIDRTEYILRPGDRLTCPGGVVYTISGPPIGYGGSSVVYPATRSGAELEYAVKECFPAGRFLRRDGVAAPADPDDPAAAGLLERCRSNLASEQRIGQRVRNSSTRAVSICERLRVEAISVGGRTYDRVGGGIFSLLERMDRKARSFDDILEQIRSGCSGEELRRTKGLPRIHTTACLMEEVLTALQAVHDNDIYYGDLHNGNVCFTETDLAAGRVGIAHLLDFGSSRELDADGRTAELTGEDVFSTKGFRPPEMLEQGTFCLTRQADIYSAGCLLLRCVATEAKLRPLGESPAIYPGFLDETDGRRIGCSGNALQLLNGILERALEREPADRYPDVQTMLLEVRRLKQNTEPPAFRLPANLSGGDCFLPGSRSVELDRMEAHLKTEDILFIWGVGGIGKTETAISLAKRIRPEKGAYLIHYHHSLRRTILSLPFEGYTPPTRGRSGPVDEDADYARRLDILKRYYAGALFVIDDLGSREESLDHLRAEKAYQDLIGLGLKLIFTTRCPVPWQPQHELQPLSEADQLALMRRHCPDPAVTEEELRPLIDVVGGNTLTICLIAKTLFASEGSLTPGALLRAFQKSRVADQRVPSVVTDQNRTYTEATLYSHLATLFDLSGLGREARAVLDCCSFLPAEGMDVRLFRRGLEPETIPACDLLAERGWIRKTDAHALQIHPLIREMVRESIRGGSSGYLSFARRLCDLWDREAYGLCVMDGGIAKWYPHQLTGPHLRQITGWACQAADFLEDAPEELLWLAAGLLYRDKRHVMGRHYAERALSRRDPAASCRELALHFHRAAVFYYDADWPLCLEYGARACGYWEQLLDTVQTEPERSAAAKGYAQTCAILCRCCFTDFHYAVSPKQCRYEQALNYGYRALELEARCGAPDEFLLSRVHQMLAGTYAAMYRLGRRPSEGLFLGLSNHLTLRRLCGSSRQHQLEHLEEALAAAGRMDRDRPGWLAMLWESMGDARGGEEARTQARAALELMLTVTTPNRDSQSAVYDGIAELYSKLGESKKALAYKMQKDTVRSGRWHLRYLEWFQLSLRKLQSQGCSPLALLRVLWYLALMLPAMFLLLIAVVLLLADTIREAIDYFGQNQKDARSLER